MDGKTSSKFIPKITITTNKTKFRIKENIGVNVKAEPSNPIKPPSTKNPKIILCRNFL